MKTDSTKPGKRSGFEAEISCPLTVVDVDVEFQRPAPLEPKPSVSRSFWRRMWPWACFIACSVVSYFIVSHFIVTTVVVQGRSMTPTLADGDRYLLHRWQLLFRAPERGDLVVIRDAARKDFVVKRVVALPGERVQFKDSSVWINGQRLNEPYLPHGTRTVLSGGLEALVLVGADRYFVMGDNRDISEDSRAYGPVSGAQILGFIPQ
jgi:signal peptidase I